MFWRVHNYDLKKKTFSCLTVGRTDSIMVLAWAWMFGKFTIMTWKKLYSCFDISRNDNYDPKKKMFGGCIITSKKKGSVVWPSVRMVGGVAQVWMFWQFIITTWKKKHTVVWSLVGMIITTWKKKDTDVWRVHNYVQKKRLSCLAVFNSTILFGGINWWHSRTPIRCLPGKRIIIFQYYLN